jgi:Zn-dependent alcohol dehydrogenase
MRASVLFEQGKPLSVEDVELEAPRTGEVLVRMTASGVCHSCLHAADGSWKGVPCPSCWATRARAWWKRSAPA